MQPVVSDLLVFPRLFQIEPGNRRVDLCHLKQVTETSRSLSRVARGKQSFSSGFSALGNHSLRKIISKLRIRRVPYRVNRVTTANDDADSGDSTVGTQRGAVFIGGWFMHIPAPSSFHQGDQRKACARISSFSVRSALLSGDSRGPEPGGGERILLAVKSFKTVLAKESSPRHP